jgi:riboflavin-specific deaminase-like protein
MRAGCRRRRDRASALVSAAEGARVPVDQEVPAVRQLLPEARPDVSPYDAYRSDGPLLRCNMVMSLDGSVVDREGRSGGLGGAGDREVFRTLRALCDAVLVGAGTARAEGYGPHRLRADLAARRRADGRPAPAAVVVVSRSLRLDPDAALFTDARTPTVVLTCAAAPAERLAVLRRRGVVLSAGGEHVDLAAGVRRLRDELGFGQLLCEGGPALNAGLLDADLVDELCVTVAPRLLGAPGRPLVEPLGAARQLDLLALLTDDGELFARYGVRRRSEQP